MASGAPQANDPRSQFDLRPADRVALDAKMQSLAAVGVVMPTFPAPEDGSWHLALDDLLLYGYVEAKGAWLELSKSRHDHGAGASFDATASTEFLLVSN